MCEGYRTDVTIVPQNLMTYDWFATGVYGRYLQSKGVMMPPGKYWGYAEDAYRLHEFVELNFDLHPFTIIPIIDES